jgi:hypothetical protein
MLPYQISQATDELLKLPYELDCAIAELESSLSYIGGFQSKSADSLRKVIRCTIDTLRVLRTESQHLASDASRRITNY